MATTSHNANGHRRRQLRARVLAEEAHCALCGGPVDKTLRFTPGGHGQRCPGGTCTGCSPHPMSPVVDEDLPRSRGGSPYERENCHLMHRSCNGAKGTMTITEYKTRGHGTTDSETTPKIVVNLVQW